jgi:AcrR family transcriptional regulator
MLDGLLHEIEYISKRENSLMTEMHGRNERKEWAAEQRRERIVAKAVILFAKKNIDQITLEEVAKASGYTVQNLYSYFRDKEDLFAAVLLKGLNSMISVATNAFNKSDSGIKKLQAAGYTFFKFCLKNPKYFDLWLRFEKNFHIYHKHPSHRRNGNFIVQCQKVIDQTGDILIEAIKIGIKDGSIKTTLDPKHLMLFLWAQTIGVTQVIIMRERYFDVGYKLTTKMFIAEYKSFLQKYLSKKNS